MSTDHIDIGIIAFGGGEIREEDQLFELTHARASGGMISDRVEDILIVDPDYIAHIARAGDGMPQLWRAFLQLGENYTTVCDDLQLFLVIRFFGHVVEKPRQTRFLHVAAVLLCKAHGFFGDVQRMDAAVFGKVIKIRQILIDVHNTPHTDL